MKEEKKERKLFMAFLGEGKNISKVSYTTYLKELFSFLFQLFKFMTSSDTHACIARLLRKKVPTGTEFSSLFQLAHMQYQNAVFKK